MGRFKDWVMEMQDDAMDMELQEFVDKHGEVNIDIWRDVNDPFYEKPNIFSWMVCQERETHYFLLY